MRKSRAQPFLPLRVAHTPPSYKVGAAAVVGTQPIITFEFRTQIELERQDTFFIFCNANILQCERSTRSRMVWHKTTWCDCDLYKVPKLPF